jgi:hypothetical protein
MPPTIPVVIRLAKEHAESVRRCVDMLYEAWAAIPPTIEREHARELLWDIAFVRRRIWHNEYPMQVLDWALEWAYKVPPPPVTALREARSALQSIADNWEAVATRLRAFGEQRGDLHSHVFAELIEHERWAASEKRRLEFALAESWPVDTQENEEDALKEIKAGAGLGMDEVFSAVAAVNKKEWLRRVKEHKEKNPPGDTRG